MSDPTESFVSIVDVPPTKPVGHSAKKRWQSLSNKILVSSFVVAVSIDPLFFYIPIIDKDNKCLGVDKSLRAAALTLRTLTDVTFLVSIVCQIRDAIKLVKAQAPKVNSDWKSKVKALAEKLSWPSMGVDFLAVFPIPQVLLVHLFFEMEMSGYLEKRKLLNVFLLGQYLPRIYRIHLSTEKLKQTGKWAKCTFNIMLYILASHVLGAFWYYFSIQRETACWHRACLKQGTGLADCMSYFYCNDHNLYNSSTQRNATVLFLEEKCSVDVPANANATAPFDFGIFLDSLKSGSTVSKDFPQKFFYCFWWGLRNLSNFGTNLQTSNYIWENCFAILVSIIGLLLFLYLLGNVQTLIQMSTTKSEEIRQKIKIKENDLETWMDKHGLPEDMSKEIEENIHKKLQENKDADLEDLFSLLPWYTAKRLRRFLCMSTLRKIPMLKNMDERVLKMICDYLKQVKYPENSIIVKMGDPLDRMHLITDGTIWTYTDSNGRARTSTSQSMTTNKAIQKGSELYGEELLKWAAPDKSFEELPIATENVKCHTKVEGFVLMAKDLRSIVSKCEVWWNLNNNNNHFVH